MLTAKFAADFASFFEACKNAERHLTDMSAGADRAGARLNAMQDSFSGKKIIQDATLISAAVERAGGASVLTAKEMARVNATVTEAIAKYAALGQTAPANMLKLADATKAVEAPTGGLSAKMVALGTAIGTMAASALIALTKLAVEGIGKLVTGMGDLILKGAGVADVSENFTRLTTQAGLLGSTLLGTLRAGTHATVTDFELMKTVNQDLAAGMVLTDQQFGTLAKGAFALAQATGTDVKTAFDTMNDAMLTGRTRALALLTGKVDLEAAETKYAASIDTTRKNLNDTEKLEAAREGILDGVTAALGRLGVQTDGLDEKVAQGITSWQNFKDKLGAALATSSVLMTGLDSVGHSLTEAFGGSQEKLIEAITAGFNKFAIWVVDAGISLVEFGRVGVQVFQAITVPQKAMTAAFIYLVERFSAGMAVMADLAASVPGVGRAFDGVADSARKTADTWGLMRKESDLALTSAIEMAKGQGAVMDGFDKTTDALWDMKSAMVTAIQLTEDQTSATDKLVKISRDLGRTLSANEIAEYAQRLKSAHKVLADFNEEVAKQNAGFARGMASMSDFTKELEKYTERTGKAIITNALIGKAAETERSQFVRESAMTTVNFQIQEIERWAANEKLKLDQSVAGWEDAAAKIEAVARAKTDALIEADELYQRILFANLDTQAKAAGDQWKTSFGKALEGIPDTLARAFEGGGGLAGAFKSIGIQLATAITEPLKKELSNLQNVAITAGSGIAAALGGKTGGGAVGAIAGVGAGLGGAALAASAWGTSMTAAGAAGTVALGAATLGIGAAAVGIALLVKHSMNAGKAVREANTEIAKMHGLLIQQYGTLENLELVSQRVGISFKENWGHQGQAGLEATALLMQQLKERTEAVAGAIDRVSGGFSAVVTGMTKPWTEFGLKLDASKKGLDETKRAFDALGNSGTASAAQLADGAEKVRLAGAAYQFLSDTQKELAQTGKQELADLGVVAVASFGAAMVAGKSYSDSIALLGPSVATLGASYKALGLDVEDVGLKHLILQSTVAKGNPELIAAASGLGSAMQGLAQLGMLNVDSFDAMQRTGSAMYARLQGEVHNLGGDSRDALLPMQGYLQDAATQAALLGLPLSDNTKLLIDQSKELGIWKDKGVTAQDKLIAGMQLMVDKVDKLLQAMLGFSGAITNLPARRDIEINVTTNEKVFRTVTDVASGRGPLPEVAWGGAQAKGGDYFVTRPTLFLAGDAGPEHATFSGAGKSGGGGGGGDGAVLEEVRYMIRDLPRAIKLAVSDAMVGA